MLALEWNLDDAKQAWFEEGMEQGREQGREQERKSLAIKLIRRGRPFNEIHEDTGLPIQYIQQLAQNNSAN